MLNPIMYGRDPRFVANPDKLLNMAAGVEAGDGSEYIKYVKKYHKAHPDLSWKQAMKKASKSYHKLDVKAVAAVKPAKKASAKSVKAVKKAGTSAGIKPFTTLLGGDAVIPYVRDAKESQKMIADTVRADAIRADIPAPAGALAAGSILGSIGEVIGNIFGLGDEDAGIAAGRAYSPGDIIAAGKKSKKAKAGVKAGSLSAGNILGSIGDAIGSIFGFGAGADSSAYSLGLAAGQMDPRLMDPKLIVAAMDHKIIQQALKAEKAHGGVLSAGEKQYAKQKMAVLKAIARDLA